MASHGEGESVGGMAIEVRGGIVGGSGGAAGGRQRETEGTKRGGCAKQGGVATRALRSAQTKERRCLCGEGSEHILTPW
jgi:hypothetical protein